jgi:hypothetical protein
MIFQPACIKFFFEYCTQSHKFYFYATSHCRMTMYSINFFSKKTANKESGIWLVLYRGNDSMSKIGLAVYFLFSGGKRGVFFFTFSRRKGACLS